MVKKIMVLFYKYTQAALLKKNIAVKSTTTEKLSCGSSIEVDDMCGI